MRHLGLLAILVSGCDGGSWILVVDDAALDAVAPNGTPWCAGGAPPDVYVVAKVARLRSTTSTKPRTMRPAWQEPVLEADETSFHRGTGIEMWIACSGAAPRAAGVMRFRPPASAIEGGGIELRSFGGVADLRLHFEPAENGGASSYDGGYGYVAYYDDPAGDGSYDTWVDTSDDGTWNDGSSDPGGWDDGSGDSSGDDGSGDSEVIAQRHHAATPWARIAPFNSAAPSPGSSARRFRAGQ